MKYEIIIFDADETLFDFKKSEREALKNAMSEFGVDYDENYHLKIYKPINSAMWTKLEKGLITQEKLKTERFKIFFDKLNLNFDKDEFASSYMRHLSNASFLYDNSVEVLSKLSKHYKLLIITNGLSLVQSKRIKDSSVSHFFEKIIISEDIGISKPNPYIFEHTLRDVEYSNKSKIIIVGDSLSSDIQGGINFGIDTCWFNPNSLANTKDIKPTYEIDNLMGLSELIEL
ncbi:MAG: YjjG family noncanonical pyrimidine nucleotidase [Acidaminobacteraceae bacterium]